MSLTLKSIGKGIAKLAGKAIQATPIGRVATIAAGALGVRGTVGAALGLAGRPQAMPGGAPTLIPRGIGGPSGFQVPSWLPGPSFLGGGQRRITPGAMGECPKGYHLNKSKTSDGLPARTFCTRNRSMNAANGRAAIRAGRRLKRTAKVLKTAIRFTSSKPPKGRPIARGGRKR
jgi:hypothetical protein